MRPRWLLLAVSLICLLVLAPASAMSAFGVRIGCGTAKIDGVLGADEWEPATVLPMSGEVIRPEGGEVSGPLLLMNDETHLYVGTEMATSFEIDPDDWYFESEACFSDEGDPLDDEWASTSCPSHEGCYDTEMDVDGFVVMIEEEWEPFREADACEIYNQCDDEPMGPGVAWAVAADETIVHEWALDLEHSYLDKIDLGDCFLFASKSTGAEHDPIDDPGDWEAELWSPPDDPEREGGCSQPDLYLPICLNECEPDVVVEDFVPEPATIMLMGSGLMGLAGYARLRLRKK